MSPTPHALLRPFPPSYPSLSQPSDLLVPTDVPARANPRQLFLFAASTSSTPPPIIARSAFVPLPLVDHLMREKRDSAIGSKYRPGTGITNAEAVVHSFVTALVKAKQCADYAWEGGHSAVPLGTTEDGKHRLARQVVLSTSLHNDFEDDQVAELFFAVERNPVHGNDLLASGSFSVPTVAQKNDDAFRTAYDRSLKQHAVFHLLPSRSLPSLSAVPNAPWSLSELESALRSYLSSPSSSSTSTPSALLRNRFVRLPFPPQTRSPSSDASSSAPRILSLELLYATHLHSLINELSALEALIPLTPSSSSSGEKEGGYAYTFDPPAIFARRFPAELSTLLMLCALREVVLATPVGPTHALPNMRLFALNAFTPSLSSLLPLLPLILPPHVRPLPRSALFPPPSLTLASPSSIPELRGATLVIHNNSDAFGQNIESEAAGGSVDGVVGSWGDGARGLRRGREDLVRWVG
ncbi:hypothetical protein JCM6882_005445 [Rhodosporidiobolus microsporus]